jgi:hypothetical protein
MDACLKPVTGNTTDGWIEPARGCNEGVLDGPETASAAASEFCTWQHVRSPAEEETGQFAPQQGASIAATPACAIPQPRPACSPSTSAIKARSPFFTKIKLILCRTPGNILARNYSTSATPNKRDIEESACNPLTLTLLLSTWASACSLSKLVTNTARDRSFSCFQHGIPIALQRSHETDSDCSRVHFVGWTSHDLSASYAGTSVLEFSRAGSCGNLC